MVERGETKEKQETQMESLSVTIIQRRQHAKQPIRPPPPPI